MQYLVAAVIVVGGIATLNLLLTFGVIRRLREHTDLLASSSTTLSADVLLGPGQRPQEFAAVTTDGEVSTDEGLTDGHLVAFFSPTCGPCQRMAPQFAQRAATVPGGRSRVLTVVLGQPAEVRELVALFEPVSKVVVEPDVQSGAISRAFNVSGFPAVAVLGSDGIVIAAGSDVPDLSLLP